MVEVYIGLRTSPLPTIFQIGLFYCWFYLLMVMREVDIGIRLATFLHITIVDYKLSTQGFLNNLFQGLCKEKISKTVTKDVLLSTSKLSLLYLYKHDTTPHLAVSILHLLSYLCTLWSFTPSSYTILRLFTYSTTHYSSLLHITNPIYS